MFQNFSKMSNIYIPELMELDSYWQKAVEDAICDTLKGEKRLYYALRNRKKIKQKLEMLGLKTTETQMSFSSISKHKLKSPEDKESSVSSSERSASPQEELKMNKEKERSTSKTKGEPLRKKRKKSPERPLLGNGSLEKMRKSQNSFICDPMGVDNLNTEESDFEEEVNSSVIVQDEECNDDNKKLEWLHVRKNSDFEVSDSESASLTRRSEGIEEKTAAVRDKNYFINKKFRISQLLESRNCQQMRMSKSGSDSPWEIEKEDYIGNPDPERKLQVALAKRKILNENLNAMSIGTNCIEVGVQSPAVKLAEMRWKTKNTLLSPFMRFYLEVYREFCHKCTVKEIDQEAGKRWWNMTTQEKAVYSKFSSKD